MGTGTVSFALGPDMKSRGRCNQGVAVIVTYYTNMSISKSASKRVNFDHFKEADGEITFTFPGSKRSAMVQDYEDEDDEAPDDVSFESSNKLVKQIEKGIKDQIEHEDQIRKGKIRQRHALYLQQKQEKLATMNEKLPSHVLKAVAAASKNKETTKEIVKSLPVVKQKKIKSKAKNTATKKKSLKKVSDGDYIPLETKTTKFHVRLVESELKAASKVPKNLSNFRQKMLDRNMKREPVGEYLAKMNAKRISNVPPTAKIPVKLLENL